MAANIRHSSAHADHYTPPLICDAAREVLGQIDLDPASSERANRVVCASRFFTEEQNGFERSWEGTLRQPARVFLNPPGGMQDEHGRRIEKGEGLARKGQSAQKAWWFKLAREWMEGRVDSAIFVGFSVEILQTTQVDVPVIAATASARSYTLPIPLQFPMCFPARRLAYWSENAKGELVPGKSPPHASVLVYLPSRFGVGRANFERVFGKVGAVVRPMKLAFTPDDS